MKKSLLIFYCLLSLSALSAQNIRISLLKDAGGHYPLDTLAVYVETTDHKPLPNLKKDAFRLYLKEERITPLTVDHLINVSPARIMFCLDISGTMAGEPFNSARISIEKWLKRLPPNVETGLCTVGDDFRIVQFFTKNRQKLYLQLQALTPGDQRTELFYSVFKALESFEKSEPQEMRFLILFSDGKNEGSGAYNIDDCVKKARQEHVIIHSVGLHRIDSRYLKNLEKLSDLSGGVFLQPVNGADIQQAYQQIYRYLFSSYFITCDLTQLERGVVAPLRLQINSRYGKAEITSARLTAIPSGFPYYYIIALALVLVLALLAVLLIRRKSKHAVEELESGFKEEINRYEGQIDSFKENLSELASELSATLPQNEALPAATRIIDPRLEPAAFLQFEEDCAPEQIIEIKHFPARIGKNEECEIRLNEATVSRQHAVISNEDGQYFITDQNSTNGTWVNGKKIQQLAINDGDTLRFGKCRCIFKVV